MDPLGGEAPASAYKVAFLNAANSPVLRDILLSQRPWLKEFSADSRGGSAAGTSGPAPPPTLEALLRHGFNILITDRVKVPSSTPGRLDNLFDLLGPARSPQLSLVNHLPNSEALTDKGNLVRALNRLLHGSGDVHVFDVIPTTYYLPGGVRSESDSPVLQQFFKRFAAVEHKAAAGAAVRMPEKHCAGNVWVIKPVASGSAGGTVICNSAVDIKTYISHIRGDYVIQKCAFVAAAAWLAGWRASAAGGRVCVAGSSSSGSSMILTPSLAIVRTQPAAHPPLLPPRCCLRCCCRHRAPLPRPRPQVLNPPLCPRDRLRRHLRLQVRRRRRREWWSSS